MKSFLANVASASIVASSIIAISYLMLQHEANVRWRAKCEMAAFNGERLSGLAYRQCIAIWRADA